MRHFATIVAALALHLSFCEWGALELNPSGSLFGGIVMIGQLARLKSESFWVSPALEGKVYYCKPRATRGRGAAFLFGVTIPGAIALVSAIVSASAVSKEDRRKPWENVSRPLQCLRCHRAMLAGEKMPPLRVVV
jgi:hypothetical protein